MLAYPNPILTPGVALAIVDTFVKFTELGFTRKTIT